MTTIKNRDLAVFALGGLDEIGKNMYVVEYKKEIIIIDSGIKFPGDELFGIDYVIPNYTYLIENKERIKGLFITHGHEDHIGGIPFLLKEINIPIYAGKLALELIKEKLKEHGLFGKVKLYEIEENKVVPFKEVAIDFFKTTHSTPDSYGIVVKTPIGNIVHTGDFKFDLTPIGNMANLSKIADIGKEGVHCLLSDSTNSEIPGFSMSEMEISKSIHELFNQLTGRIIFATFASNMYRFKQAIDVAVINKRKIVVLGRSLVRAVRIGQELGYIKIPDDTLINPSEMRNYPDDKILIICTGSQGEQFAALSRMADKRHPQVSIGKDDTVIFSSSPIPGNAISINRIIDKLSRSGARVIHHKLRKIHTSGHGAQEELKLMLTLLKPTFFVPIHGEYRMLKKHVDLANECGVPYDHSFILDNGQILEMNQDHAKVTGSVPANPVYVDGQGIGDIGTIVLRDRKTLSGSGILLTLITIDKTTKTIVSGPEVITRGFVFMRESGELLNNISNLVDKTVTSSLQAGDMKWSSLKNSISDVIGPYIYKETKRKPMILPIIMEVRS
ncbi:ribonuclease J [Aquibacillus koreensis]|uniref:Ribonuclease J n=1 Tax=Aquibacillus koreensis TaxID=279446 RepID=A0A9X3WLI1_9BACI|nr:ribonuclease J [Aquibacillus koreensis]MCT2536000.1 ribonuclease J [Aquibacillus koreensis]MDC3420456.1 ribonuclease J [Aquibacillus koreensis]